MRTRRALAGIAAALVLTAGCDMAATAADAKELADALVGCVEELDRAGIPEPAVRGLAEACAEEIGNGRWTCDQGTCSTSGNTRATVKVDDAIEKARRR